MEFNFSKEEELFRDEIRSFLEREWPEENRKLISGEETGTKEGIELARTFRRKLGEQGYLSLTWPKEYGGQERSPIEQNIFFSEIAYARAPFPKTGVNMIAPTIIKYGTEEQKRKYLPLLATGEIDFCLGYTESEAGSDLASLRTRAVLDDDGHYIINGQKVFTSGAHRAEYCWLAARTDQDAPKHKGISVFIIDMNTPGLTIDPLHTMGNYRSNIIFLDNVKVPIESLVGEENKGWNYITTALDFERVAFPGPASAVISQFERFINDCKVTKRGEHYIIEEPEVRFHIAQLSAKIQGLQLLNDKAYWMLQEGKESSVEASVLKVYGGGLRQQLADVAMEVFGHYAQLEEESELSLTNGEWELYPRSQEYMTIGGGADEIQRNIIATRGLGLPR